ncbi:YciI family protein [Chitinophagaceae bacterium LWZ2-11]
MPQFLILAKDYTDSEALQRRLAVREKHLMRVREEKTKGSFIMGGAKLTDDNKMFGSMLIVDLPSIEAVHEWLSTDPYVKDKVWESYEVIPFKIAEV